MILLGWAGCKDKHLSKYSSIYSEQVTVHQVPRVPGPRGIRVWAHPRESFRFFILPFASLAFLRLLRFESAPFTRHVSSANVYLLTLNLEPRVT